MNPLSYGSVWCVCSPTANSIIPYSLVACPLVTHWKHEDLGVNSNSSCEPGTIEVTVVIGGTMLAQHKPNQQQKPFRYVLSSFLLGNGG